MAKENNKFPECRSCKFFKDVSKNSYICINPLPLCEWHEKNASPEYKKQHGLLICGHEAR